MTDFIACGLSHKTAPLRIRERFAPSEDEQQRLLHELVSDALACEAIILSTCNRTEFYCSTNTPDRVIPWLADRYSVKENLLKTYTYTHFNQTAMHHAIKVACGLDSMMLGEPQVLGQLKQAFQQADAIGTVGKQLRNRFRQVFSTSKLVRTHTPIGNNSMSIARAAADLVKKSHPNLNEAKVLLIGSGDTTTLVAKYLRQYGTTHFAVASRTQTNGKKLAHQLNAKSIDINVIHKQMIDSDIIISATACPLPFITKEMVEQAVAKRSKAIICVDLAIPRDIAPEVGQIDNVILHNIDDLQGIVVKGKHERLAGVEKAELIIKQDLEKFEREQLRLDQINQLITNYRQQMEQQGQKEMDRVLQSMAQGVPAEHAIRELSRRLINKFIHRPTVKLRQAAYEDHPDELIALLTQLFTD